MRSTPQVPSVTAAGPHSKAVAARLAKSRGRARRVTTPFCNTVGGGALETKPPESKRRWTGEVRVQTVSEVVDSDQRQETLASTVLHSPTWASILRATRTATNATRIRTTTKELALILELRSTARLQQGAYTPLTAPVATTHRPLRHPRVVARRTVGKPTPTVTTGAALVRDVPAVPPLPEGVVESARARQLPGTWQKSGTG